jgi:hypothetical protein
MITISIITIIIIISIVTINVIIRIMVMVITTIAMIIGIDQIHVSSPETWCVPDGVHENSVSFLLCTSC